MVAIPRLSEHGLFSYSDHQQHWLDDRLENHHLLKLRNLLPTWPRRDRVLRKSNLCMALTKKSTEKKDNSIELDALVGKVQLKFIHHFSH